MRTQHLPLGRKVVMAPPPEPTPVVIETDSLPVEGAPEPSPAAEVPGSPATTEVAESSSARDALTVEEVMELATCRYINFPGVRVIDLEAPQLPEKVLEVATERMFSERSIMEMIATVSKVLQEYERAGGFSLPVTTEGTDATLEAPTASLGPTAGAPAFLLASRSWEAPLPQPAEAAEATAAAAMTGVVEAIVGEARSSSPRPVAAEANEVRATGEPAVAAQE
jgi:hypothetical protein